MEKGKSALKNFTQKKIISW